jgi:hypothetical protein
MAVVRWELSPCRELPPFRVSSRRRSALFVLATENGSGRSRRHKLNAAQSRRRHRPDPQEARRATGIAREIGEARLLLVTDHGEERESLVAGAPRTRDSWVLPG